MELKFLVSFAVSMLGSLFGNILLENSVQTPPAMVKNEVIHPAVIQERVTTHELKVPSFITNVPPGHFSGVSSPMQSFVKARRSAVYDVVRQILGSVNAQYAHQYADRVSGKVRMNVPERMIDDRLSIFASGVVLGVERNIIKSSWYRDRTGQYICFILVNYPKKLIANMRQLTKGAKVVASVISNSGNDIKLKITEVNNVSVVISSAKVTVRKINRFSRAISFFIWHVPAESKNSFSVAINPVKMCGRSVQINLPINKCKKNLKDFLLGATIKLSVVLKGNDELGRKVSARAVF
jgi:hypothetical protein